MSAGRGSRPHASAGPVGSDAEGLLVGRAAGSSQHPPLVEIQRRRLLIAAVGVVEEFGYGDTTVGQITARARISRRTFYELFSNCEECLIAVLEDALEQIDGEIARASLTGLAWRERVRGSLWVILSFFDREPALARMCVVQSLRGSERVLERRAELFAQLANVIDEGRHEGVRGTDVPLLTAEGLVGAAHGIVYERLLKRSSEPLVGLLGALMGMIVLPYLGPGVARREQARPAPASSPRLADPASASAEAGSDPLRGVPMRLTYRTVLVLECIARSPGISNRMIGDRAGISDQGQASKLLTRLERLGLAVNSGKGHTKGEANAWHLTPTGAQVVQSITSPVNHDREAA